MIYYFTGTGNSEFVAKKIAEKEKKKKEKEEAGA